MSDSIAIQKAKSLIASVREAPQSADSHISKTIELAAILLEEAERIQTKSEKKQQSELAGMMNDPIGKVFTSTITDQCFRSKIASRIVNQLEYVIHKYGVPAYLSFDKWSGLKVLGIAGRFFPQLAVSFTVQAIRKETEFVILPGETAALVQHLKKRRLEGVKVNLNHLGEAILGENEAKNRLDVYLHDLENPEVTYISVKISTLFSQINLLAWDETIERLSLPLKQLYRAAIANPVELEDGNRIPKFVNLDMEEYRDLHLTVALFQSVLDEPEFLHYSAGIVLQSYLPDSSDIQRQLTEWALARVKKGGSPIKIRIVKGANLAMEKVESAIRLWPQAPYISKMEVDANFKRMVDFGCKLEHAKAVHIGIGSHNLFDIANALLLRSENGVNDEVTFEMLEGMADHIRRVVQQVAGGMLLYCPAATKEEFQNAIAYLIRRLDENTAPENFLRHAFDLQPGSMTWIKQADQFRASFQLKEKISSKANRFQNRFKGAFECNQCCSFCNEPDTDWSLDENRKWAQSIIQTWSQEKHAPIPLFIGHQQVTPDKNHVGKGVDPSQPDSTLFEYTLATSRQVDQILTIAKDNESKWATLAVNERGHLLRQCAQSLRHCRADLIGAMIANTGKTIPEADVEVSEAIDFAEYYRSNLLELSSLEDIQWEPKGTILVTPPWNFPCSIPAGGILAALATGNCVIFKPASEAVLVGWVLVNALWQAGISRDILQFLTCEDDPVGTELFKDRRVNAIVLTGATATAQYFLKERPDLDLIAETGGKNMMVITSLSDRDLAIKDLIQSAFGHSGQKCSACSVAILESEVYDDIHFLRQLQDAAASLKVGSAWDPLTRINPLICPPRQALKQGLTQLEDGESWLLEPKQDPHNPHLWSPGIKLGVTSDSFSFQNELFGPVLSLVRAESFDEALSMMNRSAYGLTAGIHSLDEREQKAWLEKVEAGNCYINRTVTGAIVERQPFGGIKASGFGKGSKAGGPNYLIQFMHASSISFPNEFESIPSYFEPFLGKVCQTKLLSNGDFDVLSASLKNYVFYYKHYFSKKHDPTRVLGQDNVLHYLPHPKFSFIIQSQDQWIDILRVIFAAILCKTPLEISCNDPNRVALLEKLQLSKGVQLIFETEDDLIQRIDSGSIKRMRLLSEPLASLQKAIALHVGHWNKGGVVSNGRIELLHYFYEQSVSFDYHRYGNLGDREHENRAPLVGDTDAHCICQRGCSNHVS